MTAVVVVLAGCAGPEPPPQVRAEPIPACEPYRGDPTAFGRCRLFASGLGADLVPEVGRSASLDAQVRCASLRTSPGHYRACIEAAEREQQNPVAAAPDAAPEPGTSTADAAEADDGQADDAFAQLLEAAERLDEAGTGEQDYPAGAAGVPVR